MAPVFTEEMQGMAKGGVVIGVGTRDSALVPAFARGWGLRFVSDSGEARVCVAESTGAQTFANIADNQQIAVTFSKPTTYRTFQLKGRVLEIAPASKEDMADVLRHRETFLDEVGAVGLPRELATHVILVELEASTLLKTIRIHVDAVFDQTPGPWAGGRL
jgi:Pyridoxamine 5'-phosphate oxidase